MHGPAASKAVYLLCGGICHDKGGAAGEGQRPAAGPGRLSDEDKTGKVIYVGKAKKLKNRVSQYFQDSASHTVKTRQMVSQVDRFDTIFVTSEFEALVLENSLIKRHMPRYNILLKDDRATPSCACQRGVSPLHPGEQMANDSARYFGPFGGPAGDPPGPGCGALRPASAHLQPQIPSGHRGGAALFELPHGPVRRLLPPRHDGGGVRPPHRAGGRAAGGEIEAAAPGHDRRDGGGGGGTAL